jgi:hypothetical protein
MFVMAPSAFAEIHITLGRSDFISDKMLLSKMSFDQKLEYLFGKSPIQFREQGGGQLQVLPIQVLQQVSISLILNVQSLQFSK